MERYQQFAQPIIVGGQQTLSGLSFVDFLYSGRWEGRRVLPQEEGRLDLIAFATLKDPTLEWVLYLANCTIIKDPIADVTVGLEIQIPVDFDPSQIMPFTFLGTNATEGNS